TRCQRVDQTPGTRRCEHAGLRTRPACAAPRAQTQRATGGGIRLAAWLPRRAGGSDVRTGRARWIRARPDWFWPVGARGRAGDDFLAYRCEAVIVIGPTMRTQDLVALSRQLPTVVLARRVP